MNNRPYVGENNGTLINLFKRGDSNAEYEIMYRLEKCHSKRYFDEITRTSTIISHNTFQLMLNKRLFPNAKEVSESMAMYAAIKTKLKLPINGGFNCVVVGDGHTPRTAALVAARTNYNCYSIDPNMRQNPSWKQITRLSIYDSKVENMSMSFDKHTIIILPHSHVDLKTCIQQISAPSYTLITMDCCFDNSLERNPDITYRDQGVWSEKNEIKIWSI